jgi:hypothetical protein
MINELRREEGRKEGRREGGRKGGKEKRREGKGSYNQSRMENYLMNIIYGHSL